MARFTKAIGGITGDYIVYTSGVITPEKSHLVNAGVTEVSIERLDKQTIDPIKLIGLTRKIDQTAVAFGGLMKPFWQHKKNERGEDRAIYNAMIGFPVRLDPIDRVTVLKRRTEFELSRIVQGLLHIRR
jgi:hypothetical protein